MPKITLAISQTHTQPTLKATLDALEKIVHEAASKGVDLILFPEAYLGGYPRGCAFGAVVGSRSDEGREQYLEYARQCPDFGDTSINHVHEWVNRLDHVPHGAQFRGDGTRERLEALARETGVFIVTGAVERSGGSLYCAVVYVDPELGCIGKRRKVMPTGAERLVWAQGQPETLRAVTTTVKGVKLTLAAAICWENMMPLLRQSLYMQNVNLYLAPTADARDTWLPLMRTVGAEGRCFVLSANMATKVGDMPEWIGHEGNKNDWACRGGSCIIGPRGDVRVEPVWEKEELIIYDADFDDCVRGRLDLDVAGSYARIDSFALAVKGLDLSPQ